MGPPVVFWDPVWNTGAAAPGGVAERSPLMNWIQSTALEFSPVYSIEMLLLWSLVRTVTQPSGFMSGPTKPWWTSVP
jgi:hypothetical protein